MNTFKVFLCLTSLLWVSALSGGCRTGLSKIKNDWVRESGKFRESKSFSSQRVEILARLLREAPIDVTEAEFRRICSVEVPDGPNQGFDYEKTLLEALILNAVKRRDTPHLLAILSVNCPSHIGFIPMEYYVAREWPEGFPVLFDSYNKAQSEHAKQGLLLCLGRAFGRLRQQLLDNDQFVAGAGRWYKDNHAKASINRAYRYLGGVDAAGSTQEDKNLFLLQ